jgi:hypothetical protein
VIHDWHPAQPPPFDLKLTVLSFCFRPLHHFKSIPLRPSRGIAWIQTDLLWSFLRRTLAPHSQQSAPPKAATEEDDAVNPILVDDLESLASPTSLRAIIALISDSYLGA